MRDDELVKKGDDSFAFVISRSKRVLVHMKSQQSTLGPGDAALLCLLEPGVLGAKVHFDFVAMMIPAAELHRRLPNAFGATRERLSRRSEGLQLLRTYIRGLENGKRIVSLNARATVQRHLFDLAALSFETESRLGESSLSAVVEGRLSAAQEIIRSDMNNPELSVTSVADKLKISSRYLQWLFSQSETTFTSYVNVLRLDYAFTLLTDGLRSIDRISDVAMQAGFSDISYFGRLFKHRFGAAPSEIRADAIAKQNLRQRV